MKNKKNKAFTLVELIVVIIIIGILLAIAIPKMLGIRDNAQEKSDLATAMTIIGQVRMASNDFNANLDKLASDPAFIKKVQDNIDVDVKLVNKSSDLKADEWGVVYADAIDPALKYKTLQVYKLNYNNTNPIYASHKNLVVEK